MPGRRNPARELRTLRFFPRSMDKGLISIGTGPVIPSSGSLWGRLCCTRTPSETDQIWLPVGVSSEYEALLPELRRRIPEPPFRNFLPSSVYLNLIRRVFAISTF